MDILFFYVDKILSFFAAECRHYNALFCRIFLIHIIHIFHILLPFLQAPSFREIDYFLFKIHMLYCVYCVEFLHTIYFKEGSVTYGTFDNL